MEELLLALARDLPSTAGLIILMWLVNKQFTQILILVERHLDDVHRLLETCINQQKNVGELEDAKNRRRER